MAELTPKERLQPSLLDRLADDEPTKTVESREHRVLSIERIHDCVVRDLSWLLNAENLVSAEDLDDYPEAASSTINYGIISLSGQIVGGIDRRELQDQIRTSILRFEPRLLADSVEVIATIDEAEMQPNSVQFQIKATVWAQPLPLQLLVKAEVDLETGDFRVTEA